MAAVFLVNNLLLCQVSHPLSQAFAGDQADGVFDFFSFQQLADGRHGKTGIGTQQ